MGLLTPFRAGRIRTPTLVFVRSSRVRNTIRERRCAPTRVPWLRGHISSAVGRSSGSGLLDRSPSRPTRCRLDSGSVFDRRSQHVGPTHYGGAPAEELERNPLRTSLPFSPGPLFEPGHLLHCGSRYTRSERMTTSTNSKHPKIQRVGPARARVCLAMWNDSGRACCRWIGARHSAFT
jgi:hypothetical protein